MVGGERGRWEEGERGRKKLPVLVCAVKDDYFSQLIGLLMQKINKNPQNQGLLVFPNLNKFAAQRVSTMTIHSDEHYD